MGSLPAVCSCPSVSNSLLTNDRDRLLWPGSQMSLLPELTPQGEYENLSLHEAVSKGIVSFCDNLNCLHSACQTHGK